MDIMDGVILLVLLAVAGFFGWQWWKKKQEKKVPADPIAPTYSVPASSIPQTLGVPPSHIEIIKQLVVAGSPTPPARTMPDAFYTSIEALLLDLRALHFTHQVVLDGHYIWPISQAGFGPPLTYATLAGSLVQVNSALPGTAPPVTPTPTPPVPVTPLPPVMPTPPVPQPPAPPAFPGLTADEVRAGVQWNPPFHNKTDGERFPSHEARAAWVAAVLGQGQGGFTTVDVAPNYVDTRNWNHNNWLWFFQHPEVWPRVENTLYNNQMKNAHSQGGAMNVGGLPVRPDNL